MCPIKKLTYICIYPVSWLPKNLKISLSQKSDFLILSCILQLLVYDTQSKKWKKKRPDNVEAYGTVCSQHSDMHFHNNNGCS